MITYVHDIVLMGLHTEMQEATKYNTLDFTKSLRISIVCKHYTLGAISVYNTIIKVIVHI